MRTVAHALHVLQARAGTLFQAEFVEAFLRERSGRTEATLSGPV
jgi:hypothetical protein